MKTKIKEEWMYYFKILVMLKKEVKTSLLEKHQFLNN